MSHCPSVLLHVRFPGPGMLSLPVLGQRVLTTSVCLSYDEAGMHLRPARHVFPYLHLSPPDLYFEPHPKSVSLSVVLPLSPVVNLYSRFSRVAVVREVSPRSWGISSLRVALKTSLVFSSWPLPSSGITWAMLTPCWVSKSLQGGCGFVCVDLTTSTPVLRSCCLPRTPLVNRVSALGLSAFSP